MVAFKVTTNLEHDLQTLTANLIKIPSITGQEGEVATTLLNKLKDIGVDEAWIDEIGNVVGVLYGQGKGPDILLNGHMDIVPPGRLENWEYDPFGGKIDSYGNLHGRGTVDMKGGLVSTLFAVQVIKELRDKGISIPGNLIFSAVVHEEAAEMFGMEFLCRKTLPEKGLTFDVCYLAEATSGRIYLGHRGKVELLVTTRGRTAHSSTPWRGVNALEKMLPVLNIIFKQISPALPTHDLLGQGSITVTNLICRPGALSIVPDECEISVDRRYFPGETLDSLISQFEDIFTQIKQEDPDFEASVQVRTIKETSYTGYQDNVQKHHPVWILEEDNSFVDKTKSALSRVGLSADIGYWNGGTDASMTSGILGIPTIGYSGAEESLAHTSYEHIPVKVLMQDLEAYVSIVSEIFGIDLQQVEPPLDRQTI